MFCPKCAAQNVEGSSYCRVCGVNLTLVSQALSGQIQQQPDDPNCLTRRERRALRKAPTLDNAFRNAFMGIAFLLVTVALSFSGAGRGWWFWLLIPAFSMMGTGIAQYMRYRETQNRSLPNYNAAPAIQNVPPPQTFPARRNTGELVAPPPSVTEGTTRHLGAEAPTKVLGPNEPSH